MKNRQIWTIAIGGLLFLLAVIAVPAGATMFTADGTNPETGQGLSASVEFLLVGGNLQVTLTNSGADVFAPSDVLTAVFFNIAGNPALSSESALLNSGSTVLFGSAPGGIVGGEWAYGRGLAGAPGGANQGISSSGLDDLFGGPTFPGDNLQGPPSGAVDGVQYGITSGLDNSTTGNQKVTGSEALIQNSVIFTLGGLPDGFTLDDISNVSFQYGTDLDEPNTTPVPEPGTLLLLGSGLVSIGIWGRKKFQGRI